MKNTIDAIDIRLNGSRFWYLTGSGKLYPFISGGAESTEPPDDSKNVESDDPDDDDADNIVKFTQADLDRVSAREKKQGKRGGIRELMERFGFATVEEAEAFITKMRDVKPPKGKDDNTARDREVEERERKAADREAAAARRELQADIRSELVSAGAPKDRDKLSQLSRMIDVDDLGDDPDEDDIADAVAELKETWPKLFESEDEDEDRRTPDTSTAPTGGRRKRTVKESVEDQVKRRFESRHPANR